MVTISQCHEIDFQSEGEMMHPSEHLTQRFLSEAPLKSFVSTTFRSDRLKDLFLRYNTPIPSSAGVKRLFSKAKEVFKLKRNRFIDKHFEMLLFLRKIC